MNKHNTLKINFLLFFAIIALANITFLAQKGGIGTIVDGPATLAADLRPFDFTDRFYLNSGIEPAMILDRRNGTDGFSVIDYTSERNRNSIRILATHTAYSYDGTPVFWTQYGEFHKNSFTNNQAGNDAYNMALDFPIYVFPSTAQKGVERQSPILDASEEYFEKNTLGLGVAMMVEYKQASTRADMDYLVGLAKINGVSTDGTPVIRTVKEIEQLQRRNLISVNIRYSNDASATPFIIGKAIEYPQHGAITEDAFLVFIRDAVGKPLASESFFLETFECMKKGGCIIR